MAKTCLERLSKQVLARQFAKSQESGSSQTGLRTHTQQLFFFFLDDDSRCHGHHQRIVSRPIAVFLNKRFT